MKATKEMTEAAYVWLHVRTPLLEWVPKDEVEAALAGVFEVMYLIAHPELELEAPSENPDSGSAKESE